MKVLRGFENVSLEELFEKAHGSEENEVLIEGIREEGSEVYDYLNKDFEYDIFYVENVKNGILLTKTRFYGDMTFNHNNIQKTIFNYRIRKDLDRICQEKVF